MLEKRPTLCSYRIESHPGKLLQTHLKNVSTNSVNFIVDLQKHSSFLNNEKLINTLRILGFCHDVGKSTVFFQDYLYSRYSGSQFLKSHSTSSSLYGYYACKKIVDDEMLSFLTLMLIQGHHGAIPSPSSAITRFFTHEEELQKQLLNIFDLGELDAILLKENLPTFTEFKNQHFDILDLHKIKKKFESIIANDLAMKYYFISNILFSALLDADRIDASGMEIQSRNMIDYKTIENYVTKINKQYKEKLGDQSKIIQLRQMVSDTVLKNLDETKRIFSLTAPTGSGKTLTSFLFAVKLREKIIQKQHRVPRIIYVAPFISIIDQNMEVIQKALGLSTKHQSSILLSHHHLTDLVYESYDKESYSSSISQLLVEGWNAEVIVTTFVQFLETIIGARASSLRKLHNLVGSIIILDEVQAINYEYWSLIHDCLQFLATEFDTRIILMTATQPLIFKKEEVSELFNIKHHHSDRVKLEIDLSGISLNKFTKRIQKIIDKNQNNNILIIMNTITSAISVFENILSPKNMKKIFLSSGIVPYERRERLDEISSRLDSNMKTILVSTQVVEAGVDLDFDIVIRDIAPVDSIIQAAGRCNRNGRKSVNNSKVYIFAVHDGDDNYYANRIYGNVLVEKTRETLCYQDKDLLGLTNMYYKKITEEKNSKKSGDIINYIKNLDYDQIQEKFKVIEEEDTVSIFIEINEEAADIWKKFKTLSENSKSFFDLKHFLRMNRSKFYSFIINSRRSDDKIKSIPEENGFLHISLSSLSEYYGYTGLKDNSAIF